ncbi:MAG: hypothetical protein SFX72_10385 [Isosphaeraceae bacterium]|nr:hypothetical protein [Isosphaeraceae bacterium]
MQGHDRSHRGRLRLAAVELILLAWVGLGASSVGAETWGENEAERTTRESITLGADRVSHWSFGEVRWIRLEGRVSVGRGIDAFKADRAVARVTMTEMGGVRLRRVDLVAEGFGEPRRFRPGATASRRWSTSTTGDVLLLASSKDALVALTAPPVGQPFVDRALRELEGGAATAMNPPRIDAAVTRVGGEAEEVAALPEMGPAPARAPASGPEVAVAKEDRTEPAAGDDRPARLRDPRYRPVQFLEGPGFPSSATPPSTAAPRSDDDLFGSSPPPSTATPGMEGGGLEPPPITPSPLRSPDAPASSLPAVDDLDPLPGGPGRRIPARPGEPAMPADAPILPGSRRTTSIYLRSGPNASIQNLPVTADGTNVTVIRGGVNVVTDAPKLGTVDIEADEVVIYRKRAAGSAPARIGENGEVVDNENDPMEVYLHGHVVLRQDRREIEGNADQAIFRANRAYYDFRADRFLGIDAEAEIFAPGLIAPMRVTSPRVDYFHPLVRTPGGMILSDLPEIRAAQSSSTGSRFANPGYRFESRTIDVKKVFSDNVDNNTGTNTGPPGVTDKQTTWRLDARTNLFYMGRIPVFYWPRFVADADDLDPPLRQFAFRTNNYFGQQVLTDWDGFKVFGIKRPPIIDTWNLDLDYLSYRGFGLGSQLGWFGRDLVRDLTDPYHKIRTYTPGIFTDYAGYLDLWGIKDSGVDVLGGGPAVVTAFPAAGKRGYQRTSVPSFQDYRGRINWRHMQSLLQVDADPYEDFRLNVEAAYLSDRQFEEQYYKRLFDTGLDHETLVYAIRQRENWALTGLVEGNLMPFNTESQWLPKIDYYRFGDSLFDGLLSWSSHTGVDYAVTNTANEVNNKNIFAFIPYDPISNTSDVFTAGRAYTAHELEMPLDFEFLRVTPYVQGQAVGWSNQLAGDAVGRYWGAAGAKLDLMAWKAFPRAESELLNVHGLNHKVNFVADARAAYSNVALGTLGVQDDLDDNTYEFVRRYFALTGYAGGLLPYQYDPRFLLLRRGNSPISGSTDVQGSINSVKLGIHQRLQTKRGPEGRRRIIDWLVFDLDTTYFPYAERDNFGKPFGQNTYYFEWFVGDRTSIVSSGWFEFFDIEGTPLFKVNPNQRNDPFGLNVVTTGVNINRPPLGSVFLGYSVINTGPINTSALIANATYWLSPKWYAGAGTTYDFGNAILLGANASITRLGKDYLMSIGLNVDPQRRSYMFSFEIAPRLSPNLRFGSGAGLQQLDTRYAPVQ